jgi:hypothetical protein
VGEFVGEQLLSTIARDRSIGGEEDLTILGERLGIDRIGLLCSYITFVHRYM